MLSLNGLPPMPALPMQIQVSSILSNVVKVGLFNVQLSRHPADP
jgi:hypothetical protein